MDVGEFTLPAPAPERCRTPRAPFRRPELLCSVCAWEGIRSVFTPHPPRPPYPPLGGLPEESDDSLGATLRGRPDRESSPAVALLMARHWRPAHEYAVICLAASADSASMVTATAFHQVLDRLAVGETAMALRPRLL